jgi:transaldolase/glucose-6-phosphate isomerase
VTLLFAVDAYQKVHDAYMSGLEARLARGESVSGIASVASFFVSRIDASVAAAVEKRLAAGVSDAEKKRFQALNAKVAIANAKVAYARFLDALEGPRWQKLIGRHTVNTVPDATLAAFRNEGKVRDALGSDPKRLDREAAAVLGELADLGISLDAITDELLTKGCALFSDAFDALLQSVETKRQQVLGGRKA